MGFTVELKKWKVHRVFKRVFFKPLWNQELVLCAMHEGTDSGNI